jgi:peptidoglycan hydrolase-like protein with peptidoglycan-binding domain
MKLLSIKIFFVFILTFVFIFFFTHQAFAATYYINSSTGNDTTGDGTSGTPYATFHKGYTVAASTGDTLDLAGTFDWVNAGETGDSAGTGYTLAKSLTIQGQGASSTFIQASTTANTADRGVFTVSSGKTVVIKNVTIRYGVSTATETAGGITNSGTLTIQNSIISYNNYNSTANYYGAGGITLKHSAASTLNISTSTISNNTFNGKYYGSGGIYAGQDNTINITASTFTANVASSSNPTTFAYSYAEPSGALGVFRFVTTKITNSTFSGNSTNSYGGALQVYYPNSFTITNTTIANNTADAGAGGILFESVTNGYNLIMKNSILGNNTGNGTANDFYVVSGSDGRITDNGYNIVEYSTNKTWSGTGNITGSQSSLNLDSSLADNSTANGVQTLALSSGSVAIDAGNATANGTVAIPGVDQRAGTRSGTTDIGAYEYGAGGIADVTVPSVSVTAPTASATVGGSAVSLTATASDNIALGGVSFYVDGSLQGSEDTTSSYGISWNSTATSSGSHSIFAVARDTSNNYATSSSVAFTVDNTSPVISSVATSTATTTAIVTWTTDELASSMINFGLSSSYSTSTSQYDISPMVTSHSIGLAGLSACTQYHFQASSTDAVGNIGTSTDATFYTIGCTASATITSTESQSITTASGGTVTEGRLTLTVPTSFSGTTTSAVFQAHELDSTAFFSVVTAPSGKNRVGDKVFNLKALTDATTTLSTFSEALTVSLSYEASEVSDLDESTLLIYRYDGSSWNALTSCSTNTSTRVVTCSTTAFSDFAIFGEEAEAVIVTRRGHRKAILSQAVATPITVDIVPLSSITSLQSTLIKSTLLSEFYFDKDFSVGSDGDDVRRLQTFLNKNGFYVALSGPGSTGMETSFFGLGTQRALKEFQIKKNIIPSHGNFGPVTRSFVNGLFEISKNSVGVVESKSKILVFDRDLVIGMSGDDVLELQGYLMEQDSGPYARALIKTQGLGYFGPTTREAVKEFQRAKGISPVSGNLGPVTKTYIEL